jgi:hypothetical protein
MLKMNDKKICLMDFANKYGMILNLASGVCRLEKNGSSIKILIGDIPQHYVYVFANSQECVDFDLMGLLFDMISSGDIIKEESK